MNANTKAEGLNTTLLSLSLHLCPCARREGSRSMEEGDISAVDVHAGDEQECMPFHLPAFCKYLRPQRQLH
jgi:hypothetical protein